MERGLACGIEGIAESSLNAISPKRRIGSSSIQDDVDKRGLEEAHTSSQIEDLDPTWVSEMNKEHLVEPTRLKASAISIPCSIHRVPRRIRLQNENAYDPETISIGPFHYDKRGGQLKAMEEHKWRYLHDFLSRSGQGSLERCLVAVKELEESARDCYSEVIDLDSYSFVKMLVLDGCFIIEFFRKSYFEDYNDDPIFKMEWLRYAVLADLAMLENQIPFFILQRLFDLTNASFPSPSLLEWALHGFGRDFNMGETIENSGIQIQNLLHLIHTSYIIFTKEKYSGDGLVIIPAASKLEEGGIRFRKREKIDDTSSILDIKFLKGVIEIPRIKMFDNTNFLFLNLIALEQCYCHCKKYFTAYATFMDCLINIDKDVEILARNGIIENWLASDEDAAAFFNNSGRYIFVYNEDFYLSDICMEINEYYESPWPKLRATLVRDYFKNPWAIISFFAALLLLLLTIIQAFFSSFPKFAYGN